MHYGDCARSIFFFYRRFLDGLLFTTTQFVQVVTPGANQTELGTYVHIIYESGKYEIPLRKRADAQNWIFPAILIYRVFILEMVTYGRRKTMTASKIIYNNNRTFPVARKNDRKSILKNKYKTGAVRFNKNQFVVNTVKTYMIMKKRWP